MHKLVMLFSYQTIQTFITDSFDPQLHIPLQKVSETHSKLIKNGKTIQKSLNTIKQLNITPVAYTAKKYEIVKKVLDSICEGIEWVYIQNDRQKYGKISCNYAFMRNNIIRYGEGFSTADHKQQIRMAVHSALGVFNKRRFLVIQKNTQQIEKLNKKGYINIYNEIPPQDQLKEFIMRQSQAKQQEEPLKNITEQTLKLQEFMKSYWPYPLFQEKKYLANQKARPPNSRSICCMVFKNADNRYYIGKTEMSAEIGGNYYYNIQQNKILAYTIYQILQCRVIPHYMMSTLIRQSLIAKYQKKKGIFIMNPYIKSMGSLDEDVGQIQGIVHKGMYKGRKLIGLGKIVLMCILMNEQLQVKGLLQNVSYYYQAQKYFCCKTGYETVMEYNAEYGVQQINMSHKLQHHVKLQLLNERYWKQINELIEYINFNKQLIYGIFVHHYWTSNHQILYDKFMKQLSLFTSAYSHKLQTSTFQYQILQIKPVYLNYLVNSNFTYFTKIQELAGFELYFSTEKKTQSRYVTCMKSNENFQVYGSIFPINKFMKWAKNYTESVKYISLLNSKTSLYKNKIKEAKLEKKKTIFVVDHCERDDGDQDKPISSINLGLKTIFIYRLKRPQMQSLTEVESVLNRKDPLEKSEDEIFQIIMQGVDKSNCNRYELYDRSIHLWIRNKCQSYEMDYERAHQYVKILYRDIRNGKNRVIGHRTSMLYVLPIYIQRQRIYYIHNIYEFLHVKYLKQAIMDDKWDGRLGGQQLKHFVEWFAQFQEHDRQVLVGKILKLLSLVKHKLDILQLLRNLKVTKIFAQLQCVINYPTIRQLCTNYNHIVIQTQEGRIQVNDWEQFTNSQHKVLTSQYIACTLLPSYSNTLCTLSKSYKLSMHKQEYSKQINKMDSIQDITKQLIICINHETSTISVYNHDYTLLYEHQCTTYKTMKDNQIIIYHNKVLSLLTYHNHQVNTTQLLTIPQLTNANQYQIQLYYHQQQVKAVYFGYIESSNKLVVNLVYLNQTQTHKHTFQHHHRVQEFGFNICKLQAYSIEAQDDTVKVFDFKSTFPLCQYYNVQSSPRHIVGKDNSLLILSHYNYVKKFIMPH